MNRRLIVDGQIFQTPAWHRGMGKYSLALLSQLNQIGQSRGNWSSIDIIVSAHLSLPEQIVAGLKEETDGARVVKLDLLPNTTDNEHIIKHNRKVVDSYVARGQTQAVDYLMLALMQREICPVFPTAGYVKKLLLFYDLIPLMFHETYLASPFAQAEYLTKLTELLKADKYLAISKTAAHDLETHLGIDKNRIVSIDGGPIPHGNSGTKVDVNKPFILMPTGNDLRKNNRRGIQGFSKFNSKMGNRYKLVITSFFDEKETAQLGALSDNVEFTGNITGAQLNYLYSEAAGLLFPSEYEGLGLPILEAVEKHKPVACSNISVFREISKNAFHYFDPHSVSGIAEALQAMIESPIRNKNDYDKIMETYSWQNTANKLAEAVKNTTAEEQPRLRIARFGPDPSANKTVGLNMLLSHAELSRQRTTDYYLGQTTTGTTAQLNFLPYIAKATTITPGFSFDASGYDAVFFDISNESDCAGTLFSALSLPGVVVLYDVRLDEAWLHMAEQGLIDESRLLLEKQLTKDYGGNETSLLVSLMANQKAVIVFNEQAKQAVTKLLGNIGSKTKVYTIDHPAEQGEYTKTLLEVMEKVNG